MIVQVSELRLYRISGVWLLAVTKFTQAAKGVVLGGSMARKLNCWKSLNGE